MSRVPIIEPAARPCDTACRVADPGTAGSLQRGLQKPAVPGDAPRRA